MHPGSPLVSTLPRDREGILALAAQSLLRLFSSVSEGMFLLDPEGRIVWIDEGYTRFLPALGFKSPEQFVGRMVEDVVPNTQMRTVLETQKPVLIDLLTNRAGTFVVSRIPLHDDAGTLVGAIGIILYNNPEASLQPLIQKFARLQRDLDDARRELAKQRRTRYTLANFIGASAAAAEVKRSARRAAQSTSPVLLLGETGTGKELLAQGIHAASARAGGPMVCVNIAAIPESLLEAEFFGVAPGAYTGAERKGRDGKFKLASGGTLFLDEIGDMPPALQPKLLRALESGEIEPLGSNRIVPFDVRVIAATSRDLPAMVREGKFRADLYYRLNVLPLRVPPLRERRPDIPAIVEAMVDEIAQRNAGQLGAGGLEMDADAIELLAAQHWPGNIRELRNLIEQAAMVGEPGRIAAADVAQALRSAGVEARAAPRPESMAAEPERPMATLAQQVTEVEQRAIREALQRTGGNKQAAAQMLGISRGTLYQRIEELSIS